MAHGENTATIFAAIIQAIPVVGASFVAWSGLSGWRAQARGQRHIKHAARALSRGIVAIDLISSIRHPIFSMDEIEAANPEKRSIVRHQAVKERLREAWAGWQAFAESYSLTGFYGDKPEVNVSEMLKQCIFKLRSASEAIFLLEQEKPERGEPGYEQTRQCLFVARKTLLGDLMGGEMDEISTQLAAARSALETQLGYVLRSKKKT